MNSLRQLVSSLLVLFASLVVLTFAASGNAATQLPSFEDYPVGIYSGRVRAPDLASDPEAATYAKRLRDGAKGGVNFAGKYVLTYWGCGTNCLMGAAINAKTGRVILMPGTICCWSEFFGDVNPIDYSVDSRLIVLRGLISEKEPGATYYYEFKNDQFVLLKKVPFKEEKPQKKDKIADRSLVCYYDSRGIQRDADICKTGGDLSAVGVTDLGEHCVSSASAMCDVGKSGACRPGTGKYSQFIILDRMAESCPPKFQQAVDQVGYGKADVTYVTTSKDPAVINYVICLEKEFGSMPRSMSKSNAIEGAEGNCRRETRKLQAASATAPSADDIRQSVLECGFRPGEASADADCGR